MSISGPKDVGHLSTMLTRAFKVSLLVKRNHGEKRQGNGMEQEAPWG